MNTSQNPTNPTSGAAPGSSAGGVATAKQHIKDAAREAVDKVKSAASSTASRAKEESARIVGDKKNAAAEQIGGYSSAVHDSAKAFEEKDPNIAWFTHRAADRLQSVADYVRDRDFTQLRNDAGDIARRHPAVFFGGLFVAGLLVGNLLKASNRSGSGAGSTSEAYGSSESGMENDSYRQGQQGGGFGDTGTGEARGVGVENQTTS
jgi:hypothetical protein